MTLALLLLIAFSDFPVQKVFQGTPAKPVLRTAGQRQFRVRIEKAAAKGPNFAGRLTIAEWGCGGECLSVAVVDAETGTVYNGPFGALPGARIAYAVGMKYADPSGEDPEELLSYRLDSRLLIARGCPNEDHCGTYYYEWTGSQFKLLKSVAAVEGGN